MEAQRELIPSPFSEPKRRSREAPGAALVRLRALGWVRGNLGGRLLVLKRQPLCGVFKTH